MVWFVGVGWFWGLTGWFWRVFAGWAEGFNLVVLRGCGVGGSGLNLCRCFAGSEVKKWQIVSTLREGAFLDWLDRELAIELSFGGVGWVSWAWRWSANCMVVRRANALHGKFCT
jgi:hypothetical protein